MPAAIRRARLCVFPDPAPASTRKVRSSSCSIRSRVRWSRGVLGILLQPAIRFEDRVHGRIEFRLGTVNRLAPAGGPEFAPLAAAFLGRVDERARSDDVTQITQDAYYWLTLLRDVDALSPPPRGWKHVRRARDPCGFLISGRQKLGCGQAVERMLQPRAAGEHALPVLTPESAGLVVHNLVRP